MLADCLAGRSGTLISLDRIAEGAADAHRALALARDIGDPAGEARALLNLCRAGSYSGDTKNALEWARQAERIDPAAIPGWVARLRSIVLASVLADAGEVTAAQRSCADGLAWARQAGDVGTQTDLLQVMASLELAAGRIPGARAHLREAVQALGPARTRAAEERGAAMTLETATQFAIMLTAPDPPAPQAAAGLAQLSAREQELVALVSQGRTDAQIAAQLYISVSTVRSHLERIRDKSGCRRRADLTRLALQAGLV
jgi:DNA-binding CsgD family transcriptional regulator